MTQIKLHYSESLIRRAVSAFWWRATGWRYFLAILLIFAWFCFGLWSGDGSWWVGAVGTLVVVAVVLAVTLYFFHVHGSLSRFRQMRIPEATFELGEERFRVTSDIGSSEMDWTTITEVWLFPEAWLLFFSRSQFITIPTADLSADARDFILAKVKSCGGKVA